MTNRELTIDVQGSPMPAYLARPDHESGAHPAVIILQEVFGMTPEVKRVTDLLASIGYVALAINYYHRINPQMNEPYTQEGHRNAFGAAARVRHDEAIEDVRAAMDWLNAQTFVKPGKIALWGMGFGATVGLWTASISQLCGAVLFYPTSVARETDPQVPLLLVFGERDYYVSQPEIDSMRQWLRASGTDVRLQIYPEVGHSFFRHGRPEAILEQQQYSDEAVAYAVADSWNLAQVFLREQFNRSPQGVTETGDIHTQRTPQVQS